MAENVLYYGDNSEILRDHIASRSAAQTRAFEGTRQRVNLRSEFES